MNYSAVLYFLGYMLRIESIVLLPAMGISLYCGEARAAQALALTIVFSGCLSVVTLPLKNRNRSITHREGFVIVALSWIVISLVGAIPFTLSGAIPSYLDALFETVSGFTTTGSTILNEVESLPRGLLYWRSFTHWLGGMGILVFILAIAPMARGKGDSLHVLRAESSGPSVGKLVPTMRRTARLLYMIYIALTFLEMLFLLLGGMPLFDAVVNSFATVGTGGFAIKNNSIAAYDSYYLQAVITVFTLLCGINFSLFYLMLLGKGKQALKSEELRVYLGIILVSTLLITWNILPECNGLFDAFHHSLFQVVTIISSTGFSTKDYNLWPQLSRCILVFLMFSGGCAGSTAGGFKVSRILLLWKSAKRAFQRMLHPNSVKVITMDDKAVEEQTIQGAQTYLVVYLIIALLSTLLLSLDNFSFETTVTAALTSLSNIGPGLDMVGPMGNFSAFSPFSKLVLIFNMLTGRLEMFPMLLLFAPSMWRRPRRRS